MRTSVGYIGADAFLRKTGGGGGGRGGRRGGRGR
jgi:23S rRNA pseudouridine2605 synthase